MAFVNEPENKRTVDIDRNIILKMVGSGPERSMFFELEMADAVVKFTAEYELSRTGKKYGDRNICDISWRITQVTIPENIKNEWDGLWGVISQALDVYGFSYQKSDVNNVSITISPQIF